MNLQLFCNSMPPLNYKIIEHKLDDVLIFLFSYCLHVMYQGCEYGCHINKKIYVHKIKL